MNLFKRSYGSSDCDTKQKTQTNQWNKDNMQHKRENKKLEESWWHLF